jgi:hypothetical protein
MRMIRIATFIVLGCIVASIAHAQEATFRTDGGNDKLPWFQLKDGEFPPPGSAHEISGELIRVDHIARTGAIRMDRTGAQRTDEYDQSLAFSLLPYATLTYLGAPAELRDIPLGTHLHGGFYEETRDGKKVFSQVLSFEDDFSRAQRAKHVWRIDAVDLDKRILTVTGVREGTADAKPTVFQITPATRVWKGRGLGERKDLTVGQEVLCNLTVCTLKGPGRCTDIWLDAESLAMATSLQLEQHKLFQMEHGLSCQVEEVDNQNKIVTVTLFAGFDPSLRNGFRAKDHIAAAVANSDLRTHDQINDTARGPILEVFEASPSPGQSGIRLRFQPDILLEGYRPKRILRLFGAGWRIDDLPREERAYDG